MEVQEVKEQLKAIFRQVINNDKWITIHPNGEDGKGKHLLLKDGESPKEAIDRTYGKGEKSDTKDKQSGTKEGGEHEDIKEMLKKVRPDLHFNYNKNSKYPYEIKYREGKRFNLNDIATSSDKKEDIYEYLRQQTKQGSDIEKELTAKIKETKENKNTETTESKKYNYTLTKREVETNKMLGGMADTGNYYTNGDFAIDKKYLNIKGQEPTKKEEIEKSLKNILKGDSTDRYTPVKDFEIGELKREYGKPIKVAKYSYFDEKYGYERHIYLNKKYNDLFKNFDLKFGGEFEPVFAYKGKDIVGVVMPINAREQSYSKTVNNEIEEELTEDKNQLKLKIDNSKEQDMALIEELKKLITKVENTKGEEEMEIENEKVDKRKLIDEVGGILKGKVDDEVIRTIIGKMEKMSYDDSEASADNKKVKNEADEEDKKVDNEEDEKEDNKVDNEDEEDEEKVEELKKEEKKDVDNKCKNSKEENYFDKLNKIYNSAKKIEEPSADYESKQARLDAGKEYFG